MRKVRRQTPLWQRIKRTENPRRGKGDAISKNNEPRPVRNRITASWARQKGTSLSGPGRTCRGETGESIMSPFVFPACACECNLANFLVSAPMPVIITSPQRNSPNLESRVNHYPAWRVFPRGQNAERWRDSNLSGTLPRKKSDEPCTILVGGLAALLIVCVALSMK